MQVELKMNPKIGMPKTLGEILPYAASRFGSKPALIAGDAELSFLELEAQTNQLANAFVNLGVQPGERITLYGTNCSEWVVSYYAALKVGAVINPINVMLTPEEVSYVANDCGSAVLLGTADKLAPLTDIKQQSPIRELICFGDEVPAGMLSFNALLNGESSEFEPVVSQADSLSTICYTSGTTGHPKGAMHSHRNVLINANMTALMHGRTDKDTVVTALPCSHVYGNVVMNAAMIKGMTLVLHSRFDEKVILESMQAHKATLFEGVPTMYMYLLNHPELDQYDLSSLRICTVGGQTMPVAKMEEVERRFDCPLIELWGMTELAGLGTTSADSGPIERGSIGVTLPYVEAKVVDTEDASKTLGVDEVGELMMKGPIVMMGYYGNDTGTAETIEPDGWLHTGDVARIDKSGHIFIVDRKKDMIVTAGFNVYPAELERVISGHPDVAMVAVGAVKDEKKGELAKAYIIPKDGTQPAAEAIISYCREHLAAYKVPREIQFVDDFPKTSSGKVMRRKLHELDT
tara:strand:+ start:7087 stop:8643 length:1557 start_codon:yes stop_codon:yes gene_type:complete